MSGTKIAIGFVAFENVIDRNQQTMCDRDNGTFMPTTGCESSIDPSKVGGFAANC